MVLLWTTVKIPGLMRSVSRHRPAVGANVLGVVACGVVAGQQHRPRAAHPSAAVPAATMTRNGAPTTTAPPGARCPPTSTPPTRSLYGLTFRQLAILAVAAVIFYGAWHGLHNLLPAPVLLGAAVVGRRPGVRRSRVGRRDGLPMDVWLLAAVRHSRAPRALSTTDTTAGDPGLGAGADARVMLPAPLTAARPTPIDDDGEISLGEARAAMVAATTVNLALRTADEQAALIDTFGRWLN